MIAGRDIARHRLSASPTAASNSAAPMLGTGGHEPHNPQNNDPVSPSAVQLTVPANRRVLRGTGYRQGGPSRRMAAHPVGTRAWKTSCRHRFQVEHANGTLKSNRDRRLKR